MGEIVIKVPEDVHEVIDLGLSYREVKEKLEEIKRKKQSKLALEVLKKYKHTVKVEEIDEKSSTLDNENNKFFINREKGHERKR